MAQDNYHRYGSQDSAYDSYGHHDDLHHRKSQAHHTGDPAASQGSGRHRISIDESHSGNEQGQARFEAAEKMGGNPPTNHAEPQSQVSPELVAQITQQVLQNLKINGLATSVPAPPAQIPMPPPPPFNPHTLTPPSNPYIPPSPERRGITNNARLPSDLDDYQLDGQPEKVAPSVRFAERSGTPPVERKEQSRPRAPPRSSTGDTTTLEKIWQPLFDADGEPTPRLGQFLRGLAMHMIADFEPQQSLVITPAKMLQFYEAVKMPDEIYPWQTIFGGKVTNSSLSHLYRDLRCQHFFVQVNLKDKPNVPALTPVGFECWMTHLIRAHPELEFKRFADAVLNMPISNADDPKERFPKELSRRLFPAKSDDKIQLNFEDAVLADKVVHLLRDASPTASAITSNSTSIPVPTSGSSATSRQTRQEHVPASPPKTKVSTQRASSIERERKPYSGESSDVAVEDYPTPIAIERERKPYHSQPGGGKVYESDEGSRNSKAEESHARSNSVAAGNKPSLNYAQDDYLSSKASRSHRQGSTASNTQPGWRRNRSPEHANAYSRSETDMAPLNTYPGNMSQDTDDEGRRYQRRHPTEDSAPRTYATASTRGNNNVYEDDAKYGRRGSVQNGSSGGSSSSTGGHGSGYPAPPASRY